MADEVIAVLGLIGDPRQSGAEFHSHPASERQRAVEVKAAIDRAAVDALSIPRRLVQAEGVAIAELEAETFSQREADVRAPGVRLEVAIAKRRRNLAVRVIERRGEPARDRQSLPEPGGCRPCQLALDARAEPWIERDGLRGLTRQTGERYLEHERSVRDVFAGLNDGLARHPETGEQASVVRLHERRLAHRKVRGAG